MKPAGFTLVELMVVMGILSGFLLLLVQFVDTGVRLFDEWEQGQALADRAEAARVAVERELRALQTTSGAIEPGLPAERLLAQWLPIGLPARPRPTDPRATLLRATVQLDPEVELRLLEARALFEAAQELGFDPNPQEVRTRAGERLRHVPLRGRGRIVLALWPKDDVAGLLELRVARFLPDQLLPIGSDQVVDPFLVPEPGGSELPALVLHGYSELLVDEVLHFDLRFWSQRTTGWSESGARGPEQVWDSARAGWLSQDAPTFAFDRGPGSLENPTDDVFPHAIRMTLVVAQPSQLPPEGVLADDLAASDRVLQLTNGERFPGAADGGFVKVEGEWIRYAARSGDQLTGLQRGQRGTRPGPHARGRMVRVGRTVELTIPVAGAKDDWNG